MAGPPFDSRLTGEEMEQHPGEDVAEFFARIRRTVFGDYISDTDSTELIRQEPEARSEHVASPSKR